MKPSCSQACPLSVAGYQWPSTKKQRVNEVRPVTTHRDAFLSARGKHIVRVDLVVAERAGLHKGSEDGPTATENLGGKPHEGRCYQRAW